jgi:gluconokinase
MIIVVMGVAGAGKTTIGTLLAHKLGWPFFDADDFHPAANVLKMAAGLALEDADRWPWLESVREKMVEEREAGCSAVFACSALKQAYRDCLLSVGPDVRLVYLRGEMSLLAARIIGRSGHFMKDTMLASQLAALEEPGDGLVVDVAAEPEVIVATIVRDLKLEI